MALHTRAVFFQGVALRGRPGAPPVIASNPPPEGLPGKARFGNHPIFSEL